MRIAILTTDNREYYKDYDTPAPHFGTAPEALLQGFAHIPEVEVHVVSCLRQPVHSPEKLADNIWYHALLVPKLGWMRTLYQGCIRATHRKLREIRPDIVHGQGTERDCAISAVFSGFPNVLTLHGNLRLIARVNQAKLFSYEDLAARLETFTVPRSRGVVCITRYTRDAVKDLAKRTWVVPNAVDARFFEVEVNPLRQEFPTILCVGKVCPRKNQNVFIRALDQLSDKKKFRVVFLGEAHRGSAYADEFFALVESRPWCSFAGFADRDGLRKHLRGASFLVLPSLEDNCPMVVLEAMASGVPVLASKVGGIPDLIEEGRSGLFCNPFDEASMRAGVLKLLEETSLLRELTAEAKQRALARFHPAIIAQQHIEIYREVLSPDS